MSRCVTASMAGLILFVGLQSAQAQIAVQQPVVGVFGVRTTVVVPDRGAALLGGVQSAASSRSQFGPLRTGYSLGLSRQSSTASVHVYIHDFQAMDEELLAAARPKPVSRIEPRILDRLSNREHGRSGIQRGHRR